jgi:hypothetical protein
MSVRNTLTALAELGAVQSLSKRIKKFEPLLDALA